MLLMEVPTHRFLRTYAAGYLMDLDIQQYRAEEELVNLVPSTADNH